MSVLMRLALLSASLSLLAALAGLIQREWRQPASATGGRQYAAASLTGSSDTPGDGAGEPTSEPGLLASQTGFSRSRSNESGSFQTDSVLKAHVPSSGRTDSPVRQALFESAKPSPAATGGHVATTLAHRLSPAANDMPSSARDEEGGSVAAAWHEPAGGPADSSKDGEKRIDLTVVNKDINYVLQLLSLNTRQNILASDGVKGAISVTLYDTEPREALEMILKMKGYVARRQGNYLLIYTQEELDRLQKYGGHWDVLIYKPKYVSAADLKEIITGHISDEGVISTSPQNQSGIAASSDQAGGDSFALDDVIIVQDYRNVLERLKKIFERVDVAPPQVLIEAVMLSVTLDDAHRMGVNFAILADKEAQLLVSGIGSLLNSSAGFSPGELVNTWGKMRGGFADTSHGLKYGVVHGDLTAFVQALETIGNTTIVASPKVLALNKQRAEILVGRRIGYRTMTTTETATVQEVQFLDTGIELRIRPFVLPDGRVRLELHPERSSGQINPETLVPDEETTSVTTNLVIASGTTIVIGGLIQERQERTVQQLPFLGTLPYLGRLFQYATTVVKREELIVLITPWIVDDGELSADAAEELEMFRQRRDQLQNALPCETRVVMAAAARKKAFECYRRGNWAEALEKINRAIQLNPTDRNALSLRSRRQPNRASTTCGRLPHYGRDPSQPRQSNSLLNAASSPRPIRSVHAEPTATAVSLACLCRYCTHRFFRAGAGTGLHCNDRILVGPRRLAAIAYRPAGGCALRSMPSCEGGSRSCFARCVRSGMLKFFRSCTVGTLWSELPPELQPNSSNGVANNT